MDSLEDIDDLALLRNRRGQRKGALTRLNRTVQEISNGPLNAVDPVQVSRLQAAVHTQQGEYEAYQQRLITLLEEGSEHKPGNLDKEMEDMLEVSERSAQLIDTLTRLGETSNTLSKAKKALKTLVRSLDYITDEAEGSDLGLLLKEAKMEFGLAESLIGDLPEEEEERFEDKIRTLKTKLSRLRQAWDATQTSRPHHSPTRSDPSTTVTAADLLRSRLPDITLPKFSGDKLDWPSFWREFQAVLSKDKRLTEEDKILYLKRSVRTPEAMAEYKNFIGDPGDFDGIVETLKKLYDNPRLIFRNHIAALTDGKRMGETDLRALSRIVVAVDREANMTGQATSDAFIVSLAEKKLEGRPATRWSRAPANKSRKVPSVREFVQFLDEAAAQFEDEHELKQREKKITRTAAPEPSATKPRKQQPVYLTQPELTTPVVSYQQNPKPPCKLCKVERHPMFLCPTFQDSTVAQRKEAVRRLKLCFNCLGYSHTIEQCHSSRTCRECQRKHHSLLHEASAEPQQTNSTPAATIPPSQPRTTYLANAARDVGILPTAVVTVEANGRTVQARAILDVCSSASYATTRLVQQLGATTKRHLSSTSTVGNITGLQCERSASMTIRPMRQHLSHSIPITAHVSDAVAMDLPSEPLPDAASLPFLSGLELADPSFSLPGRVDLLLGSEATATMTNVGQTEARASSNGKFLAADTIFGWIVQGGGGAQQAEVFLAQEDSYNPSVFWESEEIQPHHLTLSKDDDNAMKHYEETHSREKDGRYVVRLPQKVPTPELGHSRSQAEKRFRQNRTTLIRKNQWEPFRAVVNEYGAMHHAEIVPASELDRPDHLCYYLPMHGVVKASSTTTKLRVVFDASARTSNGMSLNDTLLSGPNQYPLTTEILLKFRRHNIGMTADISKMFREIGLDKRDRDLHRFIRETEQGQTQVWRMTRVTFGVTSSPFLATRTLLQLANDYEEEHPAAARIIRHEFYVDDCLTGADSVEQAIESRTQLNELLGKARMNLRKWRTNSKELQKSIPKDLCEDELDITLLTPSRCHKTLGVHWNTQTDSMFVSTPTLEDNRIATKRQISSDLARTYDVMGWFAPAMVIAKLLLQDIWVRGLEWDDPVPESIATQWKQWTEELPIITKHPIQRCHFIPYKKRRLVQLHGFSDASEKAYGGVIYLRTVYEDATISTALITAKTRVAPTTPMTVPKLELCGATLLSQLMENTARTLDIQQKHLFAWTDSTVVLGWLSQEPGKLKVYVSNRVKTITERVPASYWRHVPTGYNPADAASRGLMPGELTQHQLWWNGPPWLAQDPKMWPKPPKGTTVLLPEIRTEFTALAMIRDQPMEHLERYSSLRKLLRITAWQYRFASNVRQKDPDRRNLESRLTALELDVAEGLLVRSVQHRYFPAELAALREKKELSPKSTLISLHPVLDSEGTLVVGGRLDNSELPEITKHPRILPKKSMLTHLIVRDLHISNHHVGQSALLHALSQRYHVTGARALVRHITNRCIPCRKAYARKAVQLMGQLPVQRTTPSPAFSHVGVDLAGPMTLKSGNPRKPRLEKAYICLFVCMSTKAIHLEAVSDLSTEAFMATLHRFVSRRGLPVRIYSDNGTNFVGANRSLNQAYDALNLMADNDLVQRYLTDNRVTWSHIPELAPHFGGLWESNIKSTKTLLKAITGSASLTYERLSTFLTQVECIMNSRPLVPMDAQAADGGLALTPGHFLVGRPLSALPDISQVLGLGTQTQRAKWNHCRKLTEQFWNQWTTTYLTNLNRYNKWTQPTRNIKVGDVVLVKDKFLFVNQWPLARVVEVHPGQDGYVRTATVQGPSCGTHKRPIVKLAVIIPEEEQPSRPGRMDAPEVH